MPLHCFDKILQSLLDLFAYSVFPDNMAVTKYFENSNDLDEF